MECSWKSENEEEEEEEAEEKGYGELLIEYIGVRRSRSRSRRRALEKREMRKR